MVSKTRFAAFAAAAALAVSLTAPARADGFVNVLTGGTSGVYYPLGVALSQLYGEGIPGVKVQVQATKASIENLNLLQQGRGEIAFALGDSLRDAWEGNTEAGFKAKLDKLRGIAAIYPNHIQIVALKASGVKAIADLKGKSLSVGAPKSGTELNARTIFAASGLKYADLGKVEYLPFAESVDLMKNRQLDATLQSAGLGVASIRDLSTSVETVIVAVDEATVKKIGAPYVPAVIPAGTYQGQSEAVPTAAVGNFLVTHADVPEEVVYRMTKLAFDNLDKLSAAHTAAKAIRLDTAIDGMPLPLHPGAARYFKEKGVLK